VVNAVSAPGGYVFVTRGLLKRVSNEASLAGVLSHEIAHVTRKDAFAIYQKTKVDQCKSLAYAKAGQKEGTAVLRSYTPGFINQAYAALQAFSGGALDLNAAANNALLTLFSDEFVHRYLEGGYARDQENPGRRHRPRDHRASGYSPPWLRGLQSARCRPGQNFFAHHPPPSDRVASMKLLLGKTRMASVHSTAPGSPFSPYQPGRVPAATSPAARRARRGTLRLPRPQRRAASVSARCHALQRLPGLEQLGALRGEIPPPDGRGCPARRSAPRRSS
jgi:hypothetical protein